MHPLPTAAARQCGVFHSEQAVVEGWTGSALRHAVRRGRLVRLRVGAYQVVDVAECAQIDEFEQRRWRHAAPGVAAALTVRPAVASHSTAAVLAGLRLLTLPHRPCVTVARGYSGDLERVHLHRVSHPLPAAGLAALCVLSVERTVLDLAREHGTLAGLVALDHALHEGRVDPARLTAELRRCRAWPGARHAHAAAALADGRSESVLESRSRLVIIERGLPAPDLQVSLGNSWGGFVGRPDFYWDEFGVVGEVDGAVKYADAAALYREKRRQDRLEDLGLVVVRWGLQDLRDPRALEQRLLGAFARAAAGPRAERRWVVLPHLAHAGVAATAPRRR